MVTSSQGTSWNSGKSGSQPKSGVIGADDHAIGRGTLSEVDPTVVTEGELVVLVVAQTRQAGDQGVTAPLARSTVAMPPA